MGIQIRSLRKMVQILLTRKGLGGKGQMLCRWYRMGCAAHDLGEKISRWDTSECVAGTLTAAVVVGDFGDRALPSAG